MPPCDLEVIRHHLCTHLLRGDLRLPPEFLLRLGGRPQQRFHLGGAEILRINAHHHIAGAHTRGILPNDAIDNRTFLHAHPFEPQGDPQLCRRPCDELAHGILHAGGDHEILCHVLLQHHPLHAHIILGVPPIAQRVEVAHIKTPLQPLRDIGQAARDLARDKGFATAGAFVVKKDAVAGIDPIGLAIINRDPIGVHLGNRIGAARVKGCFLRLWCFLHQAIQLRS